MIGQLDINSLNASIHKMNITWDSSHQSCPTSLSSPVQNDQATSLLSHTLLHTGLAISISRLSLSLCALAVWPFNGVPIWLPRAPEAPHPPALPLSPPEKAYQPGLPLSWPRQPPGVRSPVEWLRHPQLPPPNKPLLASGQVDPGELAGRPVRGPTRRTSRPPLLARELRRVPLQAWGRRRGPADEQLPPRLPPAVRRPVVGARTVHLPHVPSSLLPRGGRHFWRLFLIWRRPPLHLLLTAAGVCAASGVAFWQCTKVLQMMRTQVWMQ